MQDRECGQQAVGPCLVGCEEVVCPAVVFHVDCLHTSHDWSGGWHWPVRTEMVPALDKQQSPACFGLTEKVLSGYLELLVLVITRVSPCCLSPTTVSCIKCAAVHNVCNRVQQEDRVDRRTATVQGMTSGAQDKVAGMHAGSHLANGHGQHAIALIVDMFTNQVDAACM